MKNRTTTLAAAASLALAASLAALSGCSCCPKESGAGAAGQPQAVNIQVQLTPAGIFVFPNSTHLRMGRQHPVWILTGAPDGSCLEVKFKKEDPLEPEPPDAAKAAGPCKSVIRRGVPKPGTEGRVFAYGVTVTLPDGATKSLDPDIEVDR